MKVQVLASVMNQEMEQIAEKMHLDSDAVIINQCDHYDYQEMDWKGHLIRFFSCAEKGVGRSRNNAVLRAEGDICLFADEDIVYEEGYAQKIAEEFERQPEADMILFNIDIEESRRTYYNTGRKRVRWYNCGRYGAVSFAVRLSSLLESRVMFSLLYGGGAKYSNGEDSLFLKEFLEKGYRVMTAPIRIGREEAGESSWFKGYDQKFFYDRGVLYHDLYGWMAPLMALRFLAVHKGTFCRENGIGQAYKWMKQGIRRGGCAFEPAAERKGPDGRDGM